MQHTSNFCDFLTHQKRYSANTITAYKNDLEQFQFFLAHQYQIGKTNDVTSSIIRSWIVQLIEEEISPRSITRKISTLKSFYKYLLKTKVVTTNPLLKVISPKTATRLPVYVTEKEMSTLFDKTEFDNDFEGCRNQLMLELFYATGIRLSELIGIHNSSIDFNNNTLKVLGKRNKERIIPVGNQLKKLVLNYIKLREYNRFKSDFFFLTKKGEKMYPKLVYRIVNHYLSTVTTLSKKSPHILRHTFATHMLNNGAELNSIKEILGHANLSATQVYTHNTIEKLKNIHKQAHPKG
ncbi:MAG: integrase [Flavobacteriales bacterium CG_4_10_14_0_2_um_filter_32_8]|nr:MAG: integrase [Flavobacteriales bacterium CG_4_10_14_0_2_um_filter_32_8]PJB14240.1 MAG: integrase [Flavobacteriales bacterium CG_4_9_14_3_um_filter_32_8]